MPHAEATVSASPGTLKFNHWRVRLRADGMWVAKCRCGTVKIKKNIGHIKAGRSVSCGCEHKRRLKLRNEKHGLSSHPLYVVWKAMHQRCSNEQHPQYEDYGGRGVRVCARWSGDVGASNFIEDMGERPEGATVERRNNAKGYSPTNCFWASRTTQNRNKRNNLMLTVGDKTQCLAAWAEETGINAGTIRYRVMVRGLSHEEALCRS